LEIDRNKKATRWSPFCSFTDMPVYCNDSWYESVEQMQTDLDSYLEHYNTNDHIRAE